MLADVVLKRGMILKVGWAEKKWKYEDEISFLLPYMKDRPTICPITTVPAFDNDDNANEEEAQSPKVGQQTTDTSPSTLEVSQQTADTLPTTSSATTQNYPQPKRKKRDKTQTDETPSTILMKYLLDSKKNTPLPDDIEQFMAGITTTLRSFPPRDRAIAKAKIFEIVSHMEINILSRPSTSNSMVSTPSSYDTNYSENTLMPDTMQDFQGYFSPDTEELTYEHLK